MYTIEYGYIDEDNVKHYNDVVAESMLHAADILYRLNAELFEVYTRDINGKKKDCTRKVLHIIQRYVTPCYNDL